MIGLLIGLVSGALGGNLAGNLSVGLDQGAMINSVIGILGGFLGGVFLTIAGVGATLGSLDIDSIIMQVASAGVGGGLLLIIFALFSTPFSK